MLTPAAKAAYRLHCLEVSRAEFVEGDKTALLRAILVVASSRQAMPDWMVEPIYHLDQRLRRGELADVNEAFGWTKKGDLNKKRRVEHSRKQKVAHDVFMALCDARREGKGMGVPTFEEIAEGLKIKRPTVESVWKERKEEVLKVAPGSRKGSFVHAVIDYW